LGEEVGVEWDLVVEFVELWRYGGIEMDLGAEEKADVTVWAATHD